MIRSIYRSEAPEIALDQGWSLLLTPQGAFDSPLDIKDRSAAIAATVPGTVAQSLSTAGLYDSLKPSPLHDQDAWYFLSLEASKTGKATLCFDGLATIADIYLNGTLIHQSQSMFVALELPVTLRGKDELAICFRALAPYLDRPYKRARWRSAMMSHQGLRAIRTTTLGYMPGWCPEIQATGPWRAIRLVSDTDPMMDGISIRTELGSDGTGLLYFNAHISDQCRDVALSCAGRVIALQPPVDGTIHGILTIPSVEPWWPNSHGPANLHEVHIEIDGTQHLLGKTGFRRVERHNGANGDGFGLTINGERVFCRGAVWSSADLLNLTFSREIYAPILKQARDAGMNMLRIAGTGVYEGEAFFDLCDEYGIMVWQDMMLANFDYPANDQNFMALLNTETEQLIMRHRHAPSLIVLCGGSEMQQQAAMFGLGPERRAMPELENMLVETVTRLRPDLIAVPNTPFGGSLPFYPGSGTAHYFGVGAYRQPISDARRANLSFAAECLALSNLPEDKAFSDIGTQINAPEWSALIPKDRGADWNFEDIRDHYLEQLYSLDPLQLRKHDPQRYLDFSRATSAELVTELYSELRRHGSICNGALMLMLQDLAPGCGWGMIDSTGQPKSMFYAAKRIFKSIGLSLTDEATNGLDLHIWNETAQEKEVLIELTCYQHGKQVVARGRSVLTLAPRSSKSLHATDIFGAFFDTNYAYRFGPPSHDVTRARLIDQVSGETLAEAFHFPLGRSKALHDGKISASIEKSADGYHLCIETDHFAQSLNIVIDGYLPCDNYIHLAAAEKSRIALLPLSRTTALADEDVPKGYITHLGTTERVYF